MAYLGNRPAEAYSAFQKQDFSTSATTSYTLDHPVANQNEIALFINFVRQEPTTAYTASGTSLTLTSATASSDDMYCVYLGKAVQTVNPPSGSVGSSQVAASIITGQTALGATPADTDELLISDAGTLKRVDFSHLKVANTPSFLVRRSSNQSFSAGAWTKIQFDSEEFDTDGVFDSSTNYRFTPTTAGKYVFVVNGGLTYSGTATINGIGFYKNTTAEGFFVPYVSSMNSGYVLHVSGVTELNGSGDYVEAYVYSNGTSPSIVNSRQETFFAGYKLIG